MSNQEVITEYIDSYKHSKQSQNMRKSCLNYFFKKFGYNGDIFDITTRKLTNYFTWLKNLPDINLTTKKTKWAILSSFLKWLMEDPENSFLIVIPSKRINWNGVSAKTSKSNKNVYATRREIEQICQYFDNDFRYYIVFRLLIETGMRKGELINLRIDELDIENRHIHLYMGKTMEKHYFISESFKPSLQTYLNERKELNLGHDFLFVGSHKTKYSERIFNKKLEIARNKLGIKKRITCHTFRRSLNDFRKEDGCSLEDREVLLGHKSSNVNISGYTKSDIVRFRKLYDKWNPYKELNL